MQELKLSPMNVNVCFEACFSALIKLQLTIKLSVETVSFFPFW